MYFNFQFEGNLGDEPELRFTEAGKAVCRLRVAHNTRRRHGDEWVDGPPMWVTVTAWEGLAKRIADNLHRGDTVLVESRDLSAWAYLNQHTDRPSAQLQVIAANVYLSMRFKGARFDLSTTAAAPEDAWDPNQFAPDLEPAM